MPALREPWRPWQRQPRPVREAAASWLSAQVAGAEWTDPYSCLLLCVGMVVAFIALSPALGPLQPLGGGRGLPVTIRAGSGDGQGHPTRVHRDAVPTGRCEVGRLQRSPSKRPGSPRRAPAPSCPQPVQLRPAVPCRAGMSARRWTMHLRLGAERVDVSRRALVVGILNRTRDSFLDGG